MGRKSDRLGDAIKIRLSRAMKVGLQFAHDVHLDAITEHDVVRNARGRVIEWSSPGEYPYRDTGQASRDFEKVGVRSAPNALSAAIGVTGEGGYLAELEEDYARLGFNKTWEDTSREVATIIAINSRKK